MKPKLIILFMAPALLLIFGGCDKSNPDPGDISGKLLSNTDCKTSKSAVVPDTLSCLEYSYDKIEKTLSLVHINTAFNCCPGMLSCDFKVEGNTITIEESEEHAACDCNCLYDLEIRIDGIEENSYTIRLAEPYVEPADCIEAGLDLAAEPSGSVCVTRKLYPWGLSAYYR